MLSQAEERVKSWITEVFKLHAFEKLSIEFPDVDTKGGFAAEVIYANVTGEKHGSQEYHRLIIKKGKEDDINLNQFNFRQAYINEIQLYSYLIPCLTMLAKEKKAEPFENIPHCYGTINRDESFVVLLENLKPKEFRTHELEKHQDLDHIKLVLEAYAKWHAFSFALKDQKPEVFKKIQNEFKSVTTKGKILFQIGIKTTKQQIEFITQFYEDKNIPEVVEKLKLLCSTIEEHFINFWDPKNEDFLVFRHGDSWNNNFLFHYNKGESKPDKVMIIDWQMGALGSPMTDVVSYLFLNSSRSELDHIDDLLKFYYSKLSEKMKELGSSSEKCFPWDVCIKSFKIYAPFGIAIVATAAKLSQRDQNDTYDLRQAEKDGDFNGLFGEKLKDPEKFFERADGIYQLCIEKGLW